MLQRYLCGVIKLAANQSYTKISSKYFFFFTHVYCYIQGISIKYIYILHQYRYILELVSSLSKQSGGVTLKCTCSFLVIVVTFLSYFHQNN